MEHPDDPGCWPYPFIWSTEEMFIILERCSLQTRSLHRCMCGGPCKKPTRLMGNAPGLLGEGPFGDEGHVHEKSCGTYFNRRLPFTKVVPRPSGMCEMIAGWFVTGFEQMFLDETGLIGW